MAQIPELESLVGSWRLLSAGITMSDSKERIEPYGPKSGRLHDPKRQRSDYVFIYKCQSPAA
jgi:hypothetical protein